MDNDWQKKIYGSTYVYHHLAWVQNSLGSYLMDASETDINTLQTHDFDLEYCWSFLSHKFRKRLSQINYVDGLKTNVKKITVTINKLRLFTSLSLQERTIWCDKFFPDVKSGYHEKDKMTYEHNLHVHRLQYRSAIWMIGLMSPYNWKRWITLLNQLYNAHTYCSQDTCANFSVAQEHLYCNDCFAEKEKQKKKMLKMSLCTVP